MKAFRSCIDFIDRHGVGRWALNLVCILIVAIWVGRVESRSDRVLCLQREDTIGAISDQERRLDNSRIYLSDVSEGKRRPVPGITREDITRSIADQEITLGRLTERLHTYDDLGCS